MDKRTAKAHALDCAWQTIEQALNSGVVYDQFENEADAEKVAKELEEIRDRLYERCISISKAI